MYGHFKRKKHLNKIWSNGNAPWKKCGKFYKNKRVLVTGATGFKGSWLCLWLNEMGAKVYGIGYSPNKNKNLFYKLKLNKKIKYSLIDVEILKN